MKAIKIVLGIILGGYALTAAPGVIAGYRDYGLTAEGLGVATAIVCLAAVASTVLLTSALKKPKSPEEKKASA